VLKIPFIFSILAAITLLVACSPVKPTNPCDANPDLPECQPLPCEPDCVAPKVEFTSTISQDPKPVFQGGDSIEGSFTIKAIDPDETIGVAVIFLNLVTACQKGEPCNPVQSGGDLFASEDDVKITNDIFQKVLTGDQLRAGLETSFSGKLKKDAKPNEYSMILQVFECRNTDPVTVGEDKSCLPRLAIKGYRFFVED
jgi:hypothetical protein